jgi:O-acetyl-ADP-ribose deacetylase
MESDGIVCATINGRSLELVLGDITRQQVDAIVNAANHRLEGGGGVDGAIHRAGGPAIMADTRQRYPNGCPTGSAFVSKPGKLAAKYVIHAVGPVWKGGRQEEEWVLTSAYRRSLKVATFHECQSVAFPAISTGAYGYPVDEASRVAIETVAEYLRELADDKPPQLVRFVLFSSDVLAAFDRALRAATSST